MTYHPTAKQLDVVLELFLKKQYHFPSQISSLSGQNSEAAGIEVKLPVGWQESFESFQGYPKKFGPYRLNEDMTVWKLAPKQQSPLVKDFRRNSEELKRKIFEGLGPR